MESFYLFDDSLVTENLSKEPSISFWDRYDPWFQILSNCFRWASLAVFLPFSINLADAAIDIGTFFALLIGTFSKTGFDIVSEKAKNSSLTQRILIALNIPRHKIHEVECLVMGLIFLLSVAFVVFLPPLANSILYQEAEDLYEKNSFSAAEEKLFLATALYDSSSCNDFLKAVIYEDLLDLTNATKYYRQSLNFPDEICALKAGNNLVRLFNIKNQINLQNGRADKQKELEAIVLAERVYLKLLRIKGDLNPDEVNFIESRLFKNMAWGKIIYSKNKEFIDPNVNRLITIAIELGEDTAVCLKLYLENNSEKQDVAIQCQKSISGRYGFIDIELWKNEIRRVLNEKASIDSYNSFIDSNNGSCNGNSSQFCSSKTRN